jgi:hypothetical protein
VESVPALQMGHLRFMVAFFLLCELCALCDLCVKSFNAKGTKYTEPKET